MIKCKYVLVITDDFSLTTLIHATTNNTADVVAEVLLNHWLPHYPDPDLMHTDGGTHFDCEVVKKITDARGWGHSICTPHAKWTHGVAERNNKAVLQVFIPLCRKMKVDVNKWPCLTKMVQAAMNRMRRKSRGNMSPIELTTGQKPRTAAATLHKGKDIIEILDEKATLTLRESTREMARHMECLYDMANRARRHKAKANHKRTDMEAIPTMQIGDFVLYAKHKKDTKLDYTWLGPAEIVTMPTSFVYEIRPYTVYQSQPYECHIARLRRFAGRHLHVTEQLQIDVDKDHPDNVVGSIVSHKMHDGEIYFLCRWRGFTTELDSWQTGACLATDCPDKLRDYFKDNKTLHDEALKKYIQEKFPTLTQEQQIANARTTPGTVIPGQRHTRGRRGRREPAGNQQNADQPARQQNERIDASTPRQQNIVNGTNQSNTTQRNSRRKREGRQRGSDNVNNNQMTAKEIVAKAKRMSVRTRSMTTQQNMSVSTNNNDEDRMNESKHAETPSPEIDGHDNESKRDVPPDMSTESEGDSENNSSEDDQKDWDALCAKYDNDNSVGTAEKVCNRADNASSASQHGRRKHADKDNDKSTNAHAIAPTRRSTRTTRNPAPAYMTALTVIPTAGGGGDPPKWPRKYEMEKDTYHYSEQNEREQALQKLKRVRWPTAPNIPMIMRIERLLERWYATVRTIDPRHLPMPIAANHILINLVQPATLRERISEATRTGQPPNALNLPRDWRKRATSDIILTAALLKEYAKHWDEQRDIHKRIVWARETAIRRRHEMTPAEILEGIQWITTPHLTNKAKCADFYYRWSAALEAIPNAHKPNKRVMHDIWMGHMPHDIRKAIQASINTGKGIDPNLPQNIPRHWRRQAAHEMHELKMLTFEITLYMDEQAQRGATRHAQYLREQERQDAIRFQARMRAELMTEYGALNDGNASDDTDVTEVYAVSATRTKHRTRNGGYTSEDTDITEICAMPSAPILNHGTAESRGTTKTNDPTKVSTETQTSGQESDDTDATELYQNPNTNSSTRAPPRTAQSNEPQPKNRNRETYRSPRSNETIREPTAARKQNVPAMAAAPQSPPPSPPPMERATVGKKRNKYAPSCKHVNGDICQAKENYIVHQCNCTTTVAGGLAHQIFSRFTHADTYQRENPLRQPGHISIHKGAHDEPAIVNIYGQVDGGHPKPGGDSRLNRELYFKQALQRLSTYLQQRCRRYVSIAFPWKIGCGLAAGNWNTYMRMIIAFTQETWAAGINIQTTMYKLSSQAVARMHWDQTQALSQQTDEDRKEKNKITRQFMARPSIAKQIVPHPCQKINAKITEIPVDYIAHQCDCTSTSPNSETQEIFAMAPQANTCRNCIRVAGRISVHDTGLLLPDVINIYGQIYDGAPARKGTDTAKCREGYFQSALQHIQKFIQQQPRKQTTMAVPWRLGCMRARGDWSRYSQMLRNFARDMQENGHKLKIYICQSKKQAAKRKLQSKNEQYEPSRQRRNQRNRKY